MAEDCQIQSVPKIADGRDRLPHRGPVGYGKMLLKRALPAERKRQIKRRLARGPASPGADAGVPEVFAAGDVVRVRSREEVESTLDRWRELKGCGFLPEMQRYCGTTQQVLKPVQRFVDERDYRVKKASGLYLLDGVMCEGTESFGRCDRSCLYFWRHEWLERVPAAQ